MKNNQGPKKGGFLTNLLFNIVIPVVVLTKFSSNDYLGSALGLAVALAFPVGYGLWSFFESKKINLISVLGIISVLLTGGIGLLELDPAYIAIKEAAIPGVIFLAIIVSNYTRYPLVRSILLNPELFQTQKLQQALAERQTTQAFEDKVRFSSYLLASSFFLSAVLNYGLAKWIVVSPAGTEAFNAEIGKMTALSFPVIALPCTLIMMAALFYLFKQISQLTGQEIDQFLQK